MCNARNHPPGCKCGWGEGWHQGGYGVRPQPRLPAGLHAAPLPKLAVSTAEVSKPQSEQERLKRSWVDPNAKCPVCRASVYFYASTDGGRVYFDELGPPWPKHACTDLRQDSCTSRSSSNRSVTDRWDRAGWLGLGNVQVTLVGAGSLYRVMGFDGTHAPRIQFRLPGSFEVEVVRYRPGEDHQVMLSMLTRNPRTNQWRILEGYGTVVPGAPPEEPLREIDVFDNAEL